MKSALVVGGSGFLGLPTVRRLASRGCRVFATYHANRNLPALANVSWLSADLTTPNASADWPTSCDCLIYLAQSRQRRRFPESADDAFQVHVAGLMQSLHYARLANIRLVVLASSAGVYATTNAPAKETDAIPLHARRDFTTATMLVAELLAAAYASVLPIVQLRLFFPYGPSQSDEAFMANLIQRIQLDQAITLHGRDGFLANPLFVLDAAAAIERCLGLSSSAILNLAGPENLRLRAICECLGKILGKTPVFEGASSESGPILVGDMQATQAALGWTPQTRFLDGLHLWLETKRKNAA